MTVAQLVLVVLAVYGLLVWFVFGLGRAAKQGDRMWRRAIATERRRRGRRAA